MGFAELRKSRGEEYYRGRYKIADGKYGTIVDARGDTIRFGKKREAKQAADLKEAQLRAEEKAALKAATTEDENADGPAIPTQLGPFADEWYAAQDVEPSTHANYLSHLRAQILPHFGRDREIASIRPKDVQDWKLALRRDGYKPATIATYAATLSTLLGDAADAGVINANPAQQGRRRGRMSARRVDRQPRKVWATPLQAILIGERCSVITGQPHDFVQTVTAAWTGMRWGEILGLRPGDHTPGRRGQPGKLNVERKIYELGGAFLLDAPKAGSYRNEDTALDLPPFLDELLMGVRDQARCCSCTAASARADLPCCTGATYVFLAPRGGHPRRSNYDSRIWNLAVEGWYGAEGGKNPKPARPVLVDVTGSDLAFDETGHGVGTPLGTGRYPGRRLPPWPASSPGENFAPPRIACRRPVTEQTAVANWLPICHDLDFHGLRHSHRTWLNEDHIDEKLKDQRMGHEDGRVGARYSHVSKAMRDKLVAALQDRWTGALAERARIHPHSAVPILDDLLAPYRKRSTLKAVRTA